MIRYLNIFIFNCIIIFSYQLLSAQNYGVDPLDRPNNSVTKCYVIRNAKIFQTPIKIIEKGSVIIRNGVIESVGLNLSIPNDAEIIEGDSLWVYPGFIDGLTTAGVPKKEEKDLPKVPRPGAPPDDRAGIQPDRDVCTMLSISELQIDSLRMNGFTVARVVPIGKMLPGSGAIVMLGGKTSSDMILRRNENMFAQFVDAGEMYPSTSMGIMAKFRQLYSEAKETKVWVEKFNSNQNGFQKPEYNDVISSFFPIVENQKKVCFYSPTVLEARRAIHLQNDLKFDLVLTGLSDAFKMKNELKLNNTPIFLTLSLPKIKKKSENVNLDSVLKSLQTLNSKPTRTTNFQDISFEKEKLIAKQNESQIDYYSSPSVIKKEGIRFGFTTMNTPQSDIRENIRTMIQNGLSEQDALSALTLDAAKLLNLDKQIGTIENGKLGNILVSKGNYFKENVDVKYVFVNGVSYKYNQNNDTKDTKLNDSLINSQKINFKKDSITLSSISKIRSNFIIKPNTNRNNNWLIKNATILTITNGIIIGDLEIREGKITAIGKNLKGSNNSETIDATGMYVMPGIVDAHSHIGISDVNEWTTPVSAEVWTGDVLDPTDINIYRSLAGGVTTSHLMHGSANAIGGQCQTIKHRWGVTYPDSLKFDGAPRTIKFALGENPTRVHGKGFSVRPNTRMGVEQIFRDAFTEAKRYDDLKREYELNKKKNLNLTPPKYNIRLEALADIINGKIEIHCHSYRADEIYMLMKVLKDFGIKKITFQHVNEGYKVAPELAKFGAGASVFSDWWSYKFEVYYSTSSNAAILTRNNVVTSINSDSPELVRHLNHEASKSLRYGELSDDEVLKMITINPAKQLSIDSKIGSIEVGKDADIAIYNAHPLSVYAICQKTFVDGILRFNRDQDPDDMRLFANPTNSIDIFEEFKTDVDGCMKIGSK